MIYWKLFYEFFLIGLFSIGGGAATIPYLYRLSDTTGWFSYDQVSNLIAIAESTPGAIGCNMATFSGFLAVDGMFFENVLGACIATMGLITPSIIIIITISCFLKAFQTNKYVGFVFYGLRPASAALITYALYLLVPPILLNSGYDSSTMNILDFFNIKNLLVAIVLGSFIFNYKTHPIIYVLIAAIIGILMKL